MEWVETTARSLDEAKELALDQLGVTEGDAEIEVVEEPKPGLFGRTRGTARVKARIRPVEPRPKQEKRRRNGRGRDADSSDDDAKAAKGSSGARSHGSESSPAKPRRGGPSGPNEGDSGDSDRAETRPGNDTATRSKGRSRDVEREMMPANEQCEAGEQFLTGLIKGFGYEATVSSSLDSDGVLAFDVIGDSLGLMIGPGLGTLDAIQEICRNSIQRQADGREYGKVVLDIAGAAAQRRAALEDFVRDEAQKVSTDGEDVIFEVMSRGDRKIVHDVVSEFEDLTTESVGEDPRRRVVLHRI